MYSLFQQMAGPPAVSSKLESWVFPFSLLHFSHPVLSTLFSLALYITLKIVVVVVLICIALSLVLPLVSLRPVNEEVAKEIFFPLRCNLVKVWTLILKVRDGV